MKQLIKNQVLNLLNQIPPGYKRAYFVLIALCAILVLVRCFPAFIGSVFVLLFLSAITYKLAQHLVMLYPRVSKRFIRKSWRLVVSLRQFYKVSEETEFLHGLTIFLMLVAFILIIITKNIFAFTVIGSVTLFILGSAAIFDLDSRISWLTKKAWAKLIGKAALTGLGAALVFVASAIAKQTVSELTQADSEHFTEFVGLLTALYTPLVFGAALTGIVSIVASLEFFSIFILAFIGMCLSSIAPIFTKRLETRFVDRIVQGKKKNPPQNSYFEWKGMVYLLRPVALMIATYAITSSVSNILTHFSKEIEWAKKHAVVAMHYRLNYECNNLDRKALVAKLEDNKVSVAHVGSDVIFTKQNCER